MLLPFFARGLRAEFDQFAAEASTPLAAGKTCAHNSVYRPEVQSGGTLANFSTVRGPLFDRLAEVESNEDARIRIFGRRLGKARKRAEHR